MSVSRCDDPSCCDWDEDVDGPLPYIPSTANRREYWEDIHSEIEWELSLLPWHKRVLVRSIMAIARWLDR